MSKSAQDKRTRKLPLKEISQPLIISLLIEIAVLVLLALASSLFSQKTFLIAFHDYLVFLKLQKKIDLLAIFLALSGIVYAVVHAYELRKQTAEFSEQVKTLRELEQSLSTRRLGPFPKYLNEIGKLAKRARRQALGQMKAHAESSVRKQYREQMNAQREGAIPVADNSARLGAVPTVTIATNFDEDAFAHVDVIADCLDYGSFFAPEDHAKVHKFLCRTANTPGVRVRFLVCGDPMPITTPSGHKEIDEEKVAKYQATLLGDPGFIRWIKRFHPTPQIWRRISAAWFQGLIDGEDIPDWEDLLYARPSDLIRSGSRLDPDFRLLKQLLQLRQLWFAKDLQRVGVDIAGHRDRQPIFFWIKYTYPNPKQRDSQDSALFTFAFADAGPPEPELGYRTRDPDLVSQYRQIFEEQWRKKQSPEPEWLSVLRTIDVFGETSGSGNKKAAVAGTDHE